MENKYIGKFKDYNQVKTEITYMSKSLKEDIFAEVMENIAVMISYDLISHGITEDAARMITEKILEEKEIKFHYKKDNDVTFIVEFDIEEYIMK